jgi:hypothetical protein
MSDWSSQRVEQLAPDAASLKAAQGLAKPAKWQNLGRTDRLLWGECQGSGANPYQVRVDLLDVAYKCSCPSRKLPCKHTLGLLLMLAGGTPLAGDSPPAFVDEWSSNRARRAETKQARAVSAETPPDPAAQAKRIEKRENRISSGLDQLETWLADIVRQGLASTRSQPSTFWSQTAARLVDAQAPGLARRVRELGELALSSPQWQSLLLAGIAKLQLLIDAYRNLDRLSAPLKAEVRSLVGWTQEQDALREQDGVRDRWMVVARRQLSDEQLRTQQTWLYGTASHRLALILEFAVGAQPLPATYHVGQCLDAELVYFETATPLRALEKSRDANISHTSDLPEGLTIAQMQADHAARLAGNPWSDRFPVMLGPVRPLMIDGTLWLQDVEARRAPTRPSFRHQWHLLALAGADAMTLLGEWNGELFEPLTIACRGQLFTVAQLGDLAILAKVA